MIQPERRFGQKFKEVWMSLFPESCMVKVPNNPYVSLPFDWIVCYAGRFIAVELKHNNTRVPDHQVFALAMVAEAKGGSFVIVEDHRKKVRNYLLYTVGRGARDDSDMRLVSSSPRLSDIVASMPLFLRKEDVP